MSFRPLLAALAVLSLALGGTALAASGDAPTPLKKVQVDKTGKVTKEDATVKRDTKRPAGKLKTKDTAGKGRPPLKVRKETPSRRPEATPKRMKTQDIKPDPKVERGTKPTTGDAPTKRDDAAGAKPKPATTTVKPTDRPTEKRDDGVVPEVPVKREP